MPDSTYTIRHLATDAERERFFLLAAQEFFTDVAAAELPAAAAKWGAYVQDMPGFRPEQLRGVFQGATLLAGCIIHERVIRLGAAELSTACIGAVVTDPAQRQAGVGRTLLNSAVDFAQENKQALLLLDGIPNFYHRFGFVDIFDWTELGIDPRDALALPASECQTRPATLEDVEALLALYQRHFGQHTGGFMRTPAQQMARTRRRIAENPQVIAVDAAGAVCGYVSFVTGEHRHYCLEVCADTWPAALALLQHHARLVADDPQPHPRLWWQMSPNRMLAYWITDHLSAKHPEYWVLNPLLPFAVRAQTYYHPDCDWMARPADLHVLAQAMLPEWQAQLHGTRLTWPGDLALQVGSDTLTLGYDGPTLRLLKSNSPVVTARLTATVFTQLLFGYRPLAWALTEPEQDIPPAAQPVLAALFPARDFWIAASDRF